MNFFHLRHDTEFFILKMPIDLRVCKYGTEYGRYGRVDSIGKPFPMISLLISYIRGPNHSSWTRWTRSALAGWKPTSPVKKSVPATTVEGYSRATVRVLYDNDTVVLEYFQYRTVRCSIVRPLFESLGWAQLSRIREVMS